MFMSNSVKSKAGNPLEVIILSRDFELGVFHQQRSNLYSLYSLCCNTAVSEHGTVSSDSHTGQPQQIWGFFMFIP